MHPRRHPWPSLQTVLVTSVFVLAASIAHASTALAAAATRAKLTEPTPGSTLTSSRVRFGWTAGSGVSEIALWVGTRGAGATDIYANSQGTALSVILLGLPTNGGTIYVRLWSRFDDGWQYDDYTYTALSATGIRARLTRIVPEPTPPPANVTFSWTPGSSVSQVVLYVGTDGTGSYDLYAATQETALSATVAGVPTDGRRVYVRLWSFLDGWWQYDDYAYESSTEASAVAELTSPGAGSTLTSTDATFRWTAGKGLSQAILLWVGTDGPGSSDLYYGSQTELSRIVWDLPSNGGTVYVRLWSHLWGAWQHCDYKFQTSTDIARLTAPYPETALPSSSATFEWTAGRDVSQIVLYVGTAGAGSYDIYAEAQGTSLSTTVSGLPATGTRVYVRLWSCLAGAWRYADQTYVVGLAQLRSPQPGTWLAAADSYSDVTFEWTPGDGVSRTALYVGTAGPGSSDVYATSASTDLSAAVKGVPHVSGGWRRDPVFVRLWSRLSDEWLYIDYTYEAVRLAFLNIDPTFADGDVFLWSTVQFDWDTHFWPTSRLHFSQVTLSVGTNGPGSADLYDGPVPDQGPGPLLTGLPTDGRKIYARLSSYYPGGPKYRDYTYWATTGVAPVTMYYPPPGSPLTQSTEEFIWTWGRGVTQVVLYVGTEGVGSYDLHAAAHATTEHRTTLRGLPTGRTLHVRLWSCILGEWQYQDYTYYTGPVELTSPAPGSRLSSSTETFTWMQPVPSTWTALYVGTTGFGSFDVLAKVYEIGGASRQIVTGLPTNGTTVYVRFWSFTQGEWRYGDYTYQASGGDNAPLP